MEGCGSVVCTNLFSSLTEFICSKLSQYISRSLKKKNKNKFKSVMISVRLLLQKTDLIIMKVKFENQKKSLCV